MIHCLSCTCLLLAFNSLLSTLYRFHMNQYDFNLGNRNLKRLKNQQSFICSAWSFARRKCANSDAAGKNFIYCFSCCCCCSNDEIFTGKKRVELDSTKWTRHHDNKRCAKWNEKSSSFTCLCSTKTRWLQFIIICRQYLMVCWANIWASWNKKKL